MYVFIAWALCIIHTYERSDALAKFTHTFPFNAKLMGIKIPMFLH